MTRTVVVVVALLILAILWCPAVVPACDLKQARDIQARTPVELFGVYSNAKSNDGEHESGYTLELWRDKEGLFGVFMVHGPQIGDPAKGMISDVGYDATTGRLHFTAKLSISRGYSTTDSQGRVQTVAPSRDWVEFEGVLTGKTVTGAVTIRSSGPFGGKVSLSLPRQVKWEEDFHPTDLRPKTCAEWMDQMAESLQRLGPKW